MAIKRIRIAVCLNNQGEWNAAGWSDMDGNPAESEAMDQAIDAVEDSGAELRFWIEAEVPVPTVERYDGKVAIVAPPAPTK